MSRDVMAAQPHTSFWQHQRLACGVMLLLMFLSGAAVGALAMNFGHKRLHRDPFWTDNGKTFNLQRLQKELNLTPEQTQQMESVLTDFAQYYKTVLSDGKTRIMSILDDGQKKRFNELVQKGR